MDAEILFFMSAKDESDFLKISISYCDSITHQSPSKVQLFHLGNHHLIFTPTTKEKETLYAGKLEIRLSSVSGKLKSNDKEDLKTLFRKLRNWIKKNYWSRLAYVNQNKLAKLTPSRNYWLGPDAKLWKEANQDEHILKLSRSSWMKFELGY